MNGVGRSGNGGVILGLLVLLLCLFVSAGVGMGGGGQGVVQATERARCAACAV